MMNLTAAQVELPFVSVVIPCRNEALFIRACLDSVLANDYPADRYEILVVDGDSDDGTTDIVREYALAHSNVRLVPNLKRIIPAAMNLGIRNSCGSIILKIDAHADYDSDYVSACVRLIEEYGADCVGGVLETLPSRPGVVGQTIAAVLSHGFGAGNAGFRVGTGQPRWADTAAFGCYTRNAMERTGGYDERLIRSSDMDLNTRLRRAGGRILLAPEIRARYYCRAELGDFLRRNVLDGFWAIYPIRFGSRLMRFRHVLPLLSLAGGLMLLVVGTVWPVAWWLLGALGMLYILCALISSAQLAFSARDMRLLVLGPLVFGIRHAGYAVGASWGAMRGFIGRQFQLRASAQ